MVCKTEGVGLHPESRMVIRDLFMNFTMKRKEALEILTPFSVRALTDIHWLSGLRTDV